ncbi:MAG: hypothetical protein R3F25_04910 [Gammaproteobacteria bacterium]
MNTLNLINEFKKTFPMENPPSILSDSIQLDKYERRELDLLAGKTWIEIDCEFLQVSYDIIFHLSPDAFHYYLPGICCAGLREDNKDLLVFHSIITMLDRSPVPEYWDDFF